MKKRIFFVLAALGVLASCAKESAPEPSQGNEGQTVLSVNLPEGLKTSLSDRIEGLPNDFFRLYWSDGDAICVNGATSVALSGIPAESISADFVVNRTLEAPFKVLYPASIREGDYYVSLPAAQTGTAGNIADGQYPMVGYSADETSDISMKAFMAIMKVSVKRAAADAGEHTISYVSFKGRNNEKVNGLFSVNYESGAIGAETTDVAAEKEVKSVCNQALPAAGDSLDYFIAIPARSYSNGFVVTVMDTDGHYMEQEFTSLFFPEVGQVVIRQSGALEFVPSKTDLNVEIANAQQLIDFATAFNNLEYEDYNLQSVTLTSDITFDAESSAAFNATGGIGNKAGGEANYFGSIFDGNDKTISGLAATVPLFAFTDTGSEVKDLTLDNSCSLTVNPSVAIATNGMLVGRNKGTVSNCTSAANVIINNIQDVTSTAQHYGGLVGRNYGGTLSGCTVSGNVTCSQADQIVTANAAYIAGVAGSQADNGSISDCSFTGNITISDGTTYGSITAEGIYFYVGGVVGYADDGAIVDCTAGSSTSPTAIDVRGVFVPAVGGILSWGKTSDVLVTGCDNYMSLSAASDGARANTTPLRIGGIASRTAGTVSGSDNYGAIASQTNSTSLFLGGIVADGVNVANCINKASGTITRSNADQATDQANRYMYIGGIIGCINAAADISDCNNEANVTSNILGTATATILDLGGILGSGGQSVANAKQVDITGCNNSGQITLNNGTHATTVGRIALGGIVGFACANNSTVSHCGNTAIVYMNSQTNKAGRQSCSGGIAGLMGTLSGGAEGLEIGHCTNSARVWNRNYNNTATTVTATPFGGGIVGAIVGTADSKAYVHDCSTSGDSNNNTVELRGYAGGIAGYTQDASLAGNIVGQDLSGSNANSQGMGGLVGWAVGTSISGCSVTTTINAVKEIGGFVSKMDGTSTISACTLNANLTTGTNAAATAAAVLVSNAADGATITDCGVKGTLNGAAITLESNMITTDAGANVSGTYLILD